MDKYNFFAQGRLSPNAGQKLDTKLFYRNAAEIYARFPEWKDDDRFYFTPLYLEMIYSMGWVAEIAPDPVWLGSFVRCTMEHPELFQYRCPDCGRIVLPFRYVGSPLSGRVDLEGECNCGWKGYEMVSGWKVRAIALRDTIEQDRLRHAKFSLLHGKNAAATVEELINGW